MTAMTAVSIVENDNANSKMTKRQRHKAGSNPANTWTQHPGIKSSAARARAYLIDAGLTKSKKSNNNKDKLDPELDLDSPEVKFGRMLGSTDQKIRHKAVQKLETYLKARSDISALKGGFSELDFLKLWKGLWYTLYMADKVPVQDELSKRLAELMWALCGTEEEDEYAGQVYLNMDEKDQQELAATDEDKKQGCCATGCDEGEVCEGWGDEEDVTMEEIEKALEEERKEGFDEDDEEMEEGDEEMGGTDSETESVDDYLVKHCRGAHLVALYVRTFFRTVRREWANMDKYRIDKFYTAIRYMIAQVYKYMAKRHWNLGIIRLFNDTLFEEVLAPRDTYNVSNGMRYHLIDITLEELAKVNKESATLPLTEATLLDCLEPYFALAQNIDDPTVHKRIIENVLERFLMQYSVVSENMEKDEETEARQLVMDQVHVGNVAQFIFEVASDEKTNDRYRKSLYETHKQFSRLVKETGRDVDLNEVGEDDVEEESQSIESGEENIDKENVENDIQIKDRNVVKENTELTQKAEEKQKKASKKKKKSKKKKHIEEAESIVNQQKDVAIEKEMKTLDSVETSNKNEKTENGEEVITITKKEQKKAARAAKKAAEQDADPFSTPKASKKKKKKKERSPPSVNPHSMTDSDAVHSDDGNSKSAPQSSGSRRVKFGKVNFSKSHKASMRDLKTIEERVDLSRTPEKSILLCKRPSPIDQEALEKSKNEGKRKKKKREVEKDSIAARRTKRNTRKKASDYFE